MPNKPDPDEDKRSYMRFYSLAFELVIMNLFLIAAGYFLDDFLKSSPAFILVGTFLAMAGTIWLLLKALK